MHWLGLSQAFDFILVRKLAVALSVPHQSLGHVSTEDILKTINHIYILSVSELLPAVSSIPDYGEPVVCCLT